MVPTNFQSENRNIFTTGLSALNLINHFWNHATLQSPSGGFEQVPSDIDRLGSQILNILDFCFYVEY